LFSKALSIRQPPLVVAGGLRAQPPGASPRENVKPDGVHLGAEYRVPI